MENTGGDRISTLGPEPLVSERHHLFSRQENLRPPCVSRQKGTSSSFLLFALRSSTRVVDGFSPMLPFRMSLFTDPRVTTCRRSGLLLPLSLTTFVFAPRRLVRVLYTNVRQHPGPPFSPVETYVRCYSGTGQRGSQLNPVR